MDAKIDSEGIADTQQQSNCNRSLFIFTKKALDKNKTDFKNFAFHFYLP